MTWRRYVCPRCNREAWAVRILRMCPWWAKAQRAMHDEWTAKDALALAALDTEDTP